MPTRSRRPVLLVDTSVSVAQVVADHDHHDSTFDVIGGQRLGLAGHAAFETFSVLTRLPGPMRRTPSAVGKLLAANFPESRFLSSRAAAGLLTRFAAAGIAGGSVYDALVGATAVEHRLRLVTRDRRAVDTYRAVGADVQILGDA